MTASVALDLSETDPGNIHSCRQLSDIREAYVCIKLVDVLEWIT